MKTPPRRSPSPQQFELSVICDDIQLSSSRRTPSRKRSAVVKTSQGTKTVTATGPPAKFQQQIVSSNGRKQTRIVSVASEVPDGWAAPKPPSSGESGRRVAWTLAIWGGIIVRCCCPFFYLNSRRIHQTSRPIIAPGDYFPVLLGPVLLTHIALGIASLTRLLEYNAILNASVSLATVPIAIGVLECGWTWLMVWSVFPPEISLTSAFVLSIVNLLFSVAAYAQVSVVRRKNLAGVWHLQTRLKTRLIDYWLIEVPATCQLVWSSIAALTTYSYYRVIKNAPTDGLDDETESELGQHQITTATITFLLLVLGASICFAMKKRTSAIPPALALWVCMDWAVELRRIPDLSASPHLSVIDPVLIGDAYAQACVAFIIIFGCMTLLSVILNANNSMKRQKEANAADGTYSFIGGKSTVYRPGTMDMIGSARTRAENTSVTSHYCRRPSEFMIMRSESDGSEEDWESNAGATPARV